MAARTELTMPGENVLAHTAHLYQPGTRRPYGVLEWPAMLRLLEAEGQEFGLSGLLELDLPACTGTAYSIYSGLLSTLIDDITLKIAARIRGERTARRWSLDDLAERSQVSKAMISKIERAEASPTAALLGRLSGAYGITLSALLAESEIRIRGPVRRADQAVWRDPATGYVRRQVSASANSRSS